MNSEILNNVICHAPNLPGKIADNMHSRKKSDHLLPPALFLHSSPHNWVRKCLDDLPFIDKLTYTYFIVDKALCMDVCYLFIFYIHHFSFNRTNVAAKQRWVTHNQRQDGVRKF
jgi:hypothetical protein